MADVWRRDIGGVPQSVLLVYADHANDDGVCWPSTGLAAWKIGRHVDTVRKTVRDLRAAGVLEQLTDAANGDVPRYRIHLDVLDVKPPYVPPGGGRETHPPKALNTPPGVSERNPPGVDAAPTEPSKGTTKEPPTANARDAREQLPEHRDDPRIPKSVNRKPVTKGEAWLACRIMNYWSARLQMRSITGTDVARAIIGRIREDPDTDALEHRRIIDANLARPFWDGKAPPTVLYGNGKAWASAKAKAEGGARGASYRHPDQQRPGISATEQSRALVDSAVRELREAEARGEDWLHGDQAED